MFRIIYLVALVIYVTGCTEKEDTVDNKVFLSGRVNTPEVDAVTIEYLDDNPIINATRSLIAPLDNEGRFELSFELSRRAVGRISAGQFFHEVCFYPGDNLEIAMKGDDITYNGKGSARNNLLYQLELREMWDPVLYHNTNTFLGTPEELLDILLEIREKRKAFIRSYDKPLEDDFKEFYLNHTDVVYEDLLLLFPQRTGFTQGAYSTNDTLPQEFRRVQKVDHLVDDSKLSSFAYMGAIMRLINHSANSMIYGGDLPSQHVPYFYFMDSIKGTSRDYALASWLCREYAKGLVDSILLEVFEKEVADSFAVSTLRAAQDHYLMVQSQVGSQLPERPMSGVLEDSSGNEQTLREVLESYKGKIVYLNLYDLSDKQSIRLIRSGNYIREKLGDVPVEFVHVCVSAKNENFWDQVFENAIVSENHYRLKYEMASELIDYFKIPEVPFYMIFDAEGKLHTFNADPPETMMIERVETELEKTIKRILENSTFSD